MSLLNVFENIKCSIFNDDLKKGNWKKILFWRFNLSSHFIGVANYSGLLASITIPKWILKRCELLLLLNKQLSYKIIIIYNKIIQIIKIITSVYCQQCLSLPSITNEVKLVQTNWLLIYCVWKPIEQRWISSGLPPDISFSII